LASAAEVWRNDTFLRMMDVLRFEHPNKNGLALGTQVFDRAVLQARGEGYQTALNNLKAMSEKPVKNRDIPETFSPSNALP